MFAHTVGPEMVVLQWSVCSLPNKEVLVADKWYSGRILVVLTLVVAGCSSQDAATRAPVAPLSAAQTQPVAINSVPSLVTELVTDTVSAATDPPQVDEGWTVLVYSIADTDLEPYLLTDLGEMANVGSNANLRIEALVDRAADYSADPLLNLADWQGAKLMSIGQGVMTEEQDLGELNTGDPAVLSSFISRGIADNPAAHYALIISDHGASWPGLGGDESSGSDSLSLAELNEGISSGLAAAGVDKLDLLGFDACLMATYEVATTIASLADRLLASQELEPGHGWDYNALKILADDPTTSVDKLGSALIDGFAAQAASEGTKSAITLSMIDLNQMGAVDEAMTTFTDQLSSRVADVAPKVGQSLAKTLGFGSSPDPTEDTHMADLGILAAEIGVKALDVSDAADAVIRAINDAVLDSVVGAATRGATGLSIYFPPKGELLSPDYAGVAAHGGWSEFLTTYYGAGEAIPTAEQPQFQNAGDQAETFFDEDGLNIVGTFDLAAQDNLSEAFISYGTIADDGSITFFGDEPATISDDGSGTALGIYDLTTMTISDGTDSAQAYLTLTVDEDNGIATIDVPMAYYSPENVETGVYQDVLLTLTIDSASGDILSETYYSYDESLGTYGELTADPTGIIVPEVLVVGADGTSDWLPTSDVGLFADLPNLHYEFPALVTGTMLYIELTVTDFGGHSDTVSATVQVP